MILWLDLETTGLDPQKDSILEIAAIVTDRMFVEKARLHIVTGEARKCDYRSLHQAVQDMHYKNGLWMESLRSDEFFYSAQRPMKFNGTYPMSIEEQLTKLVEQATETDATGKKYGPILGGNTVSFDRRFIERYFPKVAERFNHRHLDVSSLHEFVAPVWRDLFNARPKTPDTHRAMSDIESSLENARYYRNALGPLPGTVVAP